MTSLKIIPFKYGNIDNMKWLKANGCQFSNNTFNSAFQNGNLENMKWVLNSLKLLYILHCNSIEIIRNS